MTSWAPYVRTASDDWTKSGLRFTTKAEAEAWACDLSGRWALVEEYGAVETEDPVNHCYNAGLGVLERLQERLP